MTKPLSTIRQTVRQILKDEFVAETDFDFQPDELDIYIGEVRVEISQRKPYEAKETLYISNKSGQATATTASHLIDTVNAQFVAGDVGKTVYNSTDKTTAKVTVYNSESDLTLDTDIVESGESYYIYHYGGTSGKDLNKSSITDLIEIKRVEYPTRQDPQKFTKFRVFGDIVTLPDITPSDGYEVFLYCNKVHTLTESSSTLDQPLEKVLVEGVVAKAAQSWLNKMRDQIVPASAKWYQDWADKHLIIYRNNLDTITPAKSWKYY